MGRVGLSAAASLVLLLGAAPAAAGAREVASVVLGGYLAAWDRADAHAIAGEFAADGDFVNPTGFYARGPAEVEAFYRSAFARGYAGSKGEFTMKVAREVSPGVIAVDGVWAIEGAHRPNGNPLPTERGLATGVLVRGAHGWRVALLREQSSASDLQIARRR